MFRQYKTLSFYFFYSISTTDRQSRERLLFFVNTLLQHGQSITDPPISVNLKINKSCKSSNTHLLNQIGYYLKIYIIFYYKSV